VTVKNEDNPVSDLAETMEVSAVDLSLGPPPSVGEAAPSDVETTVNLTGNEGALEGLRPAAGDVSRRHLKGLIEALVFVSDHPVKANELAKSASAPLKLVRELLSELRSEYQSRGIQLDEVAGGFIFRSSAAFAPFVRDVAMKKPVRLTRAQTETLAILAYRQPITRPEVDEIRGVDSGPILKLLLERDLVRILGRKDEPGRPVLYGTTTAFLEFFGLKSLRDLPTLREFTDLNEDSRRVVERELGDVLDSSQPSPLVSGPATTDTPDSPEAPELSEDPPADLSADESETAEGRGPAGSG
jgi:segregation and condensation protein B